MKNLCKQIMAFLLCISILSGALLVASADENKLNLTVAADTHFKCFSDCGEFPSASSAENIEGMLDGDVYYYASSQGQMDRESYAIVKQLLSSFVASDDDYLLIAGDLTCGKRQSHIEFAEMLRNAEEESNREIFVICGNHDCGDVNSETKVGIDEFKQIYTDFGYSQALALHNTSGSYTVDLSYKYRLIAIDSCIYGEDEGEINSSVMQWIREQAAAAETDGKELIGMMHHSILPHFYVQPMISDYSNLAEQLADMGIKIVFTGHIHANDISSATTKSGNTIYDIQTGALITSPNAFRHVSFSDSGVEITTDYITQINTDDLMEGYNAEQLRRIEESFPDYSYGFFEAGMWRWLNRYIGSAEKLGRILKLDSGSKAYQELDRLMSIVCDAINLPIYDNDSTLGELNSLEEIAQSAGYELPGSDYKQVYQIVAALMGNFYHGDDGETVMDTEVSLLFDCIRAALAHCAVNMICDGSINNLLGYLNIDLPIDSLITSAARVGFAQGVAEKLTRALLTALLDGISGDYSGPEDINVVLEVPSDTVSLTLLGRILEFLFTVFNTFKKLIFI
ncbi:MAG TPA: metallophosphoesterase [Clostridia bacterium]|nr:metallophosphoesterase [Clostridia bacterium]